ncbi:MAG: SUMF1/EgtB/PvdO family nonheme iron enzyme [Bacteroidia bacterium]|nr:SUMF1/EgtB/PvdO family nonheme iron enzyme [Bacteroidia bacterium]
MKIIFFFLALAFFSVPVFAQNISVKSFRVLANDLDARSTFPKKDQNGDVCAIIKVVTTETGFECDGDQLGIVEMVKKTSEFWLYVPYGAKRLTIRHSKLGQLRDYNYPERIEKATVYEMVLTTGKVKTIVEEEEIKTTWLTFKSVPEGADIYINDVLKGVTPLPVKLTPGKYTYRLEKAMYHNEAGAVEITGDEPGGKKEISLDLKPAFGFVKINTTPENGATVLIDDNEVSGKTPYTSDKLKSGKHKVTVKKEMYQPKSIEFTITDGKTTEETVSLSPNFANLTISTQPEADIYIDGSKTATGNYKGRILAGVHSFEGKKDKHYPDKKDKEIEAGKEEIINLLLQPKLGNLDIVSNPIDATVYIDNERKGTTPLTLKKLLIGDYTLKLEKQGFGTVTKTITVTEGKTTDISETLPAGENINITSSPSGAEIYIDGAKAGGTPYNATLSYGSHKIKLINGKKTVEETINITQGGKTNYIYNVSEFGNYTETTSGLNLEMVAVEGGSFTMGCTSEQSDCSTDENPTHKVTLSNYYIGKYEVTQKQWEQVMGTKPSYFKNCDNCPVETVSWNDIQEFLQILNTKTGKTYTLPTEAQWEYAARGGSKSKGYKYSGGNSLGDVAWFTDNSSSKTHSVGQKQANELGIFDMTGNVWEWCSDWYDEKYYKNSPANNPQGANSGSLRVYRGGSWGSEARNCRVAYRFNPFPVYRTYFIGLRLAFVP